MTRKPQQELLTPPAPAPGQTYTFYDNAARKLKIYARRFDAGVGGKPKFTVYRSAFPQPGQENMTPLGDYWSWEKAYQGGERAARAEEQRDVDAGYAAAFGPGVSKAKRFL